MSRDVSLANEDEFARGEGDNERNPDKDIAAAAQFALGVRPSNEARATVARLPGAVIMRRALVALHDDTDDEASSAAARNSKAATRATLRDSVEPNEEADFKANWQAKKGGHGEEASWATKRKSNHAAHQGGGTHSPQVLMADEEANFGANRQADKGGYPSKQAGRATKRKSDHAAHQGGGTHGPQVLTVLFCSTVGNQGKPGQCESAANFFFFYWPPGRPEIPKRRPGYRLRGTTKKPPMRLPRGRPTTRPTRAVGSCAWAPQKRHCSKPRRPLPSGAKSA